MNFFKRATPWMVTLCLFLLCYWAAYLWLYKPRYGFSAGNKGPVHLVFRPIVELDKERIRQKKQREARVFCQGNWQGSATLRDLENRLCEITFQVTIVGDRLTITSATHDSVLVGKTWQIESFGDGSMLGKSDYAEKSTAALKVFSESTCLSPPDTINLPWFPFYESPPGPKAVVAITGKRAHLQRVAP